MNRALALSAEEEVAEINRKHQSICDAPRHLLATAIEIGEWFIVQHKKIEHGDWLPWLRENFPDINARTIQTYVRLADNKRFLETKFANTKHAAFLEWPSIRVALREIDSRKKDKQAKEERDTRPRKDACDEPIEVEAATTDEADDVEFPFDKAAPEKVTAAHVEKVKPAEKPDETDAHVQKVKNAATPEVIRSDLKSPPTSDGPPMTIENLTKALVKEFGPIVHRHGLGCAIQFSSAEGKVEEVIETECGWRCTAIVDRGEITVHFYRERNAHRERIEKPALTFLERLEKIAHSCDREQNGNGHSSQQGEPRSAL